MPYVNSEQHQGNNFSSFSNTFSTEKSDPWTLSLKALYTAQDIPRDFACDTLPGVPPFIRGPNTTMYREKPWTIRQYAGFSTSQESNAFYRKALADGMQGISVAFDLPTHLGYDSDHPLVAGEVGKAGVAIDSVEDMKALFEGIALDNISVSMTMNGAVLPIMAAYIVAAEESGVAPAQLKGTIQNDILKEFMVRNTYIYPPAPSMRIVTDIIAWTTAQMPKFNPLSISGYHMQEAGAPEVLELALTLANGKAYVQAAQQRGLDIDVFAGRLSFFFASGMNFYTSIARLRAARLLWCELMQSLGAKNPRALMLRTHCQTSGWSLTAQDPLNNVVRTTVEAMAAVFGGTQSLHTNAFDEAMGLPGDASARLARTTQLILQEESAICKVIDPWAGSYMMETLTAEIAEKVRAIMAEIDAMGGMLAALDNGWVKQQIDTCACRTQAQIDAGEKVIVGVNKYRLSEEEPVDIRFIDNSQARAQQIDRLKVLRQRRDESLVARALDALTRCAESDGNLLAATIDAIRLRATVGEVTETLTRLWGRHQSATQFISEIYGEAFRQDPQWQSLALQVATLRQRLNGQRPKILIAKMGLDGHDRGAKVVASGLADLGFEVLTGALFESPAAVAQLAREQRCHAIGVSSMVAGHNTLVPELIHALEERSIAVFVGGVIPVADYPLLYRSGVCAIFGPGTPLLTSARRILDIIEQRLSLQPSSVNTEERSL